MAYKKKKTTKTKQFSTTKDIFKLFRQQSALYRSHFLYFLIPFVASLLFGLFISAPAPNLSSSLSDWKDSGRLYKHREYDIFYQDIYQIKDPKRGPSLLILHGFPTSSYDWKKLIFNLTNRFSRIIAVDMLGFGFSDKPGNYNYTVKEQAVIHEQLLKNQSIENIHLLAHDLGDTVAQEMIARYNERKASNKVGLKISSLCLTNGGILPDTHRPRLAQKLLRIPVFGDIAALLLNYVTFGFSFSEIFGSHSKPTWAELWEFWTIIRHKEGHLAAPRLLRYIDERVYFRERWISGLQNTDVPLHYIYGAKDPVNPADALELYRKLFLKSTVKVLPHVGHYPQWEDPDEFLQAYYEFLNRVNVK